MTFRAPTPEQVDAAMRRVRSLPTRRVFFEELANPLWVKPLMDALVFDNPPQPTVDSDGLIREVFWPEIDYLSRMSELVASDVVDVLLRLGGSSNSWVRRGAVEIAAKIPTDEAARLEPLLVVWAPDGFGYRTDPKDLTLLTTRLIEAGEPFGVRLAQLLFEPFEGQEKRRPVARMEDYWYEQGLPAVAAAMGSDAVSQLRKWLDRYEILSGAYGDNHDYTDFHRPAIATRDSSYPEIEQALVDALIASSTQALVHEDPAEIVRRLSKSPTMLVRRLILHVVARALDLIELDATALIALAVSVLHDVQSSNPSCRLELAELIRAIGLKDPSALNDLTNIVDAGPFGGKETLLKNLRTTDGESKAERAERADAFALRWQHRLLAAVGSDALPDDLKARLEILNAREGEIDDPTEVARRITTWVGPTSPTDKDELAKLSPAELVSYLETWRPDKSSMSPIHEGLGRELTSLITESPDAFQGEMGLVDRLRPTYVRAILSGWEAAIKAGRNPEWDQLLDVTSTTLAHPDESDFETDGSEFDDDINYLPAKHQSLSLLEELSREVEARQVPESVTAAIAELLVHTLDDESAWRRYMVEPNRDDAMDALTVSINRTWPVAVRGLTRLISFGKDAPWFQDSLDALDRELARDDPAGAVAALIGEASGFLAFYAADWTNANASRLFGDASGVTTSQQISLTTALASNRFNFVQFDLLRGSMVGAINAGDKIKSGWRGQGEPLELVGRWIVVAYLLEHIGIDDPLLVQFFESVSPDVRGDVIGNIAWSYLNVDTVDQKILDRLETVWDIRAQHVEKNPDDRAELKDFYWFVRNGKHAVAWWLPRLLQAATLMPELSTHGMIGEQLAEASKADPARALAVIRLLLDRDEAPGMSNYDLTEHALPYVIASALDSNQPDVVSDATAFMNELGAKNMVHLKDQVEEIRRKGEGK